MSTLVIPIVEDLAPEVLAGIRAAAIAIGAAIGLESSKNLVHHAAKADEKGKAKPATATQSCPLKPDDDDPCKHLRKGSGPGRYRGGAHGQMKGPTGDGLDSHHTPAAQANELGGGPARNDAPAIQMEPEDHMDAASSGPSKAAMAYRLRQAQLIKEGNLLDAAKMDIDDVKKLVAKSGDPHKYDQALKEMRAYAECLQGQIDKGQ